MEMVNVWAVKGFTVLRGMHPTFYNFWFDEMITLRNQKLTDKLSARGFQPTIID